MKKILVIGPTPPPYNGMSVVTETILNSSLRERFELINLDISDRRSLKNIGKFDIINIYLAIRHFLIFLWLIIFKKPDLIYLPIAQNIAGYLRDSLFLIPCRIFKLKTIIHLHGSYFRDFYKKSKRIMQWLVEFTLRKVSGAIVLGEKLRYIFKDFLSEDKIFVVPNGVKDDFHNFSKNYESETFQILFLGSLCKEKGVFEVLKIVPILTKKYKNLKFVFAGEWIRNKEKKEAMMFIKENGIEMYVEFPGVVHGDKKKKYLANSLFLLLLPTDYPFEGQPLVILEAMSAGLPVISTDRGAISETVIDGANGYLVEIENTKELLEKIEFLITNPNILHRMSLRSRELYLEKFTVEKFITNLEGVIKKILYF